ncbi:ribokinase, partial [Pseudomonas sp. 2822-15]|uniref:PfkB family carbohydrate kinase n=1 Tax=Pseudomonas sp. 2822-15 TaxID=1712677 RepID=UPI000C383091
TVVLNPAPAKQLPDEIFKYIDIFTPNESELNQYTGINVDDENLEQAMNELEKKGVKNIVTTLGSKGAAYLDENGHVKVKESHRVKVVDTTGAGDAFNAGLAHVVAEGKKIREA